MEQRLAGTGQGDAVIFASLTCRGSGFQVKKDVKQHALKDKVTIARQVYIKASDLVEFGLTRGCPKCDHEISYGAGRASQPHSQTCRTRIMG